MSELQGCRRPDNTSPLSLRNGEYSRQRHDSQADHWLARDPSGWLCSFGREKDCLAVEHANGTISVDGVHYGTGGWTGIIEQGVWRKTA